MCIYIYRHALLLWIYQFIHNFIEYIQQHVPKQTEFTEKSPERCYGSAPRSTVRTKPPRANHLRKALFPLDLGQALDHLVIWAVQQK